ncbi:MAG: LuxR C-terminal-related transcriptional regulator [Coriobacteriales bacterium]|jgi:DNA-binding CsgD family transcriptional regulator|nr:LuxR C-terminal-related transcriptional regulator [Coriobacteriales bacterium]
MAPTPKNAYARRSFLSDIVALWPGIRYLGLGVWLAWALLAYSGTIWLSDSEMDGRNISIMYVFSTGAFAAVLLIAPFFRTVLDKALARRWLLYAGGGLASLGALAIILAGPYYLAVPELFYLGDVLTGMGTAVLALKSGKLFGGLAPGKAVIYAMLSQMVVAVVYFIFIGIDWFHPIPGGPSLSGIVAFVGLPLLAMVLVAAPPPSGGDALDDEGTEAQASSEDAASGAPPVSSGLLTLPVSFWKFCVTILLFTVVTSMVKGLSISASMPSATLADSNMLMLLRFAVAVIFLFVVVRVIRRVKFGKLYLLIMVVVAITVTLYSSLQLYDTAFSFIVGFAFDVFDVLQWCLLAFIVHQRGISPITVFGFGRGAFMAGCVAGWILGSLLIPSIAGTYWGSLVFILLATLVLICAVLVFSEKDFDQLFSTVSDKELNLADLALERGVGPLTVGPSEPQERPRPYLAACKRVGLAARLSIREQDVFEMLAMGRGNADIAERLGISLNTSRTHTHNIYNKLDVHSRHELTALVEAELHGDNESA